MIDKVRMIKRLDREIDGGGYHGEKLRMVELVRVGEDRKYEHISDWTEWSTSKDLAAEMDEKVVEQMEGSQEPFVYFKFRFYHGTSTVSRNGDITERVENVSYHDPEFAEMVPLENPSAKGLARMHMEALHKYISMTAGERTELIRLQRDMFRDMRVELDELRRERNETSRVRQDLLDRSQERAMALKAAERMEAMKEQAMGLLMTFGPTAIGQFLEYAKKKNGEMGSGVQAPSKEAFLLEQFYGRLMPDEREGLMLALQRQLGDRAMPMLELMNDLKARMLPAPEAPLPPPAPPPPASPPAAEPPPSPAPSPEPVPKAKRVAKKVAKKSPKAPTKKTKGGGREVKGRASRAKTR